MEALQFACLLLSISIGGNAGYEIQPVDAILFLDGAPTYMRMTNSTSLEDVYACVLENSKNVDSVITATQMRGMAFDVGQVEENINENLRRLSANAARTGQSLWKSQEELRMLKKRLARYLTADYYDNRVDPEAYFNYKFQRSTDWSHNARGRSGMYSRWRDSHSFTPEPRKGYLSSQQLLTSLETSPTSSSTSILTPAPQIGLSGTITSKQSSIPIKEMRTTHIIVPTQSFKLNSSSKPFSSDEFSKIEASAAADVKEPEITTLIVENSNDTVSNTSLASSKAKKDYPSPFKSTVEDLKGTSIANRTLIKEEDISDWPSTKSSEEEPALESDDRLKRKERNGKKKNPKKKSKERKLVLGGKD